MLLGALYSRLGRHASAVEVLRRATALSPESFIANFGLGKALAADGQYDDALRSLKHAARLNGSIAELHLHMALAYDRLGLRGKAVDSFNRAIDFNPQLEQARRQIGPLDESDPDLAAKLKKYERLVDFSEDPLVTCAKIGLIDFQRGDYLRAITDFHIVLAARPGEDEIRYWLALAYDKVGDADGTARELAAVSPRATRYVDSRLFLSSILEAEGRPAGRRRRGGEAAGRRARQHGRAAPPDRAVPRAEALRRRDRGGPEAGGLRPRQRRVPVRPGLALRRVGRQGARRSRRCGR